MDASSYWGSSAESGSGLLPRNWAWFVLRGLLGLGFGAVAIQSPARALYTFTLVFAVFAFTDGILSVVVGVRGARVKTDRWWEFVLRGLIGIGMAVLFLVAPEASVIGFALTVLALVSLWSIATGVFEIAAAVRLRREIPGEWLLAISGMLSILLGIAVPLIMIVYPPGAVLSVGFMIGVYAIAAGIVLIALGLRLWGRRRKHLAGWEPWT